MTDTDRDTVRDIDRETPVLSERAQVRKQLQDRRDFGTHLVAYFVINACFVIVWLVTGGGYFWPAWILGFWGAGLVLHGWETFLHRQVSDAEVDAELQRRHS